MSVWASQLGRAARNDDGPIVVNEYYTTVNTSAEGLVVIDLSGLDVAEVLDVTVTPVITGVTTVANSLVAALQNVTTTAIRAIIMRPNVTTVSLGASFSPMVSVGAGQPCRCRVIYKR